MKEKIEITDYANQITKALRNGGILLNTNGDKFNTMVIGWGHIGTLWNRPTFHVEGEIEDLIAKGGFQQCVHITAWLLSRRQKG